MHFSALSGAVRVICWALAVLLCGSSLTNGRDRTSVDWANFETISKATLGERALTEREREMEVGDRLSEP